MLPIIKQTLQQRGIVVGKQSENKVEKALIGYSCNLISYSEFMRTLVGYNRAEKDEFRKVCYTFDLTVNLKHALMTSFSGGNLKRIMFRFNLSPQDCLVMSKVIGYGWRSRLEENVSKVPIIFSPEEMREKCSQVLKDIDKFCMWHAYKKLRFIATSNNLSLEDLAFELKVKAVSCFYYKTVYLSNAHALNTVKRAVFNHGLNLIDFYTAKKRQRLVKTEQGFTNLVQTDVASIDGVTSTNDSLYGYNANIHGNLIVKKLYESASPRYKAVMLDLLEGENDLKILRKRHRIKRRPFYRFIRSLRREMAA